MPYYITVSSGPRAFSSIWHKVTDNSSENGSYSVQAPIA